MTSVNEMNAYERGKKEVLEKVLDTREWKYSLGDTLQKKSGSSWRGKVVGFYTSSLTLEGYALESLFEPGSVQIYPVSALEPFNPMSP